MATNDARAEICGLPPTVWVFHQAIRNIKSDSRDISSDIVPDVEQVFDADCGVAPAPGNGIPAMARRAVSNCQDRPENQLLFP